MILDFATFYRQYGLRRANQLLNPRFRSLVGFQLPRRAIVHYAHGAANKYGPDESDIAFRGYATKVKADGTTAIMPMARPVWMSHVLQFAQPMQGMPVKSSANSMLLVRQFHNTYKRFRRANDLKVPLLDPSSVLAFNYDMLSHLVRYPRNVYSPFFEWMNVERTVWDNIAKVAELSDRPQFIIRNMPKVLPARSSLQQYAAMKNPSRRILNMFNSGEHLFLAEVWKWFGPNRSTSMLSAIPKDKLRRINLVFVESGKWIVLNLGLLDSWRLPVGAEITDPDQQLPKNLIVPVNYQNMILRHFMSITQLRTDAGPEVSELANQVLDHDDAEEIRRDLTTIQTVEDKLSKSIVRPAGVAATALPESEGEAEAEDTADTVSVEAGTDEKVNADLDAMEKISTSVIQADEEEEELDEVSKLNPAPIPVPDLKRPTLDEAVMRVVNRQAEEGLLTAAQFRNFEAASSAYKKIIAPDGVSTLEEYVSIPPETLKISKSAEMADIPTVPDKSMLKTSLAEFDERYIAEVFQRDVASMGLAVQHAGVAVADYRVEEINDIMGPYTIHSMRLLPTEGSASTVHWKLPIIEPDGSYMANGTKYRLRKQRGDLPIRKTAPDTVALTSYYGKSFVRRSEKKVHNYASWINNQIMAMMLTEDNVIITRGHPGNQSDNLFNGPRLYTILASSFNGFSFSPANLPDELAGMRFEMNFDHTKREQNFGLSAMRRYEQNGAIIAGKGGPNDSYYFLIGRTGQIGIAHENVITPVPRIETLLGIARAKAPVDIAILRIAGSSIALGVMLAYEIGLDGLIAILKTKTRRVPTGTRVNLTDDEEAIVFADQTLVIDRNDTLACMFLAGFNEYHNHLREYNYHLFNKRDIYLNLLEDAGLSVRHLREIDLFYQMFIDPITRDILTEMEEPTDMRRLLLRAGSMLIDDAHPDEFDAAFLRSKGYERMAGAVYTEMVKMMRSHNGRSGKGRQQLNMDPYAIFTAIQTDPSKAQVLDINPIQNLKEREAVTYNGVGGRNSRTMTKSTRAYHVNDMGTISGDTVDSGDVGINIYTSADPQYTSLRGMSRRYDNAAMGATPLLSTSALISVGTDHDDQKRVGFISIQHTHGVSCVGNQQSYVRTGYEAVVAQRTSDMYAAAAKEAGVVKAITPTGVIVEYANGKSVGYEVGKRYGNAAGLTIPHDVVINVQVGQQLKKGDIVTYNSNFFEPDLLDPKNVVWKSGVLAKVVLMETTETLEDSSAISTELAGKLDTYITKVVPIVVPFDQSVSKLVEAGTMVNPEDILCIIEDAVTSMAGLFDEVSLDTLKMLSNQAPQAKVKGAVERVEVFYHGDIEDMSDSLQVIASKSDLQLAKRLKSIGKPVLTGSVDDGFRVDGESLPYNYLAIKVYITSRVVMGEGDKGVFANQMKSVFGKKMVGEMRTEKGEIIDAVFGSKSIEDRIVLSPYIIGTTNVLLDLAAQAAVAAYRS